MEQKAAKVELDFSKPSEDVLLVRLAGDWKRENDLPSASEVEKQIETGLAAELTVKGTKYLKDSDLSP